MTGGTRQEIQWSETAASAYDVVAAEFVVVNADAADLRLYTPLSALLRRVRRALGLEAVFVTEWAGNEPLVRHWRGGEDAPRELNMLQALYGQHLIQTAQPDALPSEIEALPVITPDGIEHGTLCCRLPDAAPGECGTHNAALRSVAHLIAEWFDDVDVSPSDMVPFAGTSIMGGLPLAALS